VRDGFETAFDPAVQQPVIEAPKRRPPLDVVRLV
jgi:hypothetical protein